MRGMTLPPRFVIDKKVGETPLHALARLRTEQKIPSSVPLTYAGRLDPMAEGALLVLAGDECKRQRAYHRLDKTYRFEVLFGFSTDTGDIMGIPVRGKALSVKAPSLHALAQKLTGDIALPYPRFSSKTVQGKPLFQWTLEGRLDEIKIPIAMTHIFHTRFERLRTAPYRELRESIENRVLSLPRVTDERKKLGADFRRTEIIPTWKEILRGEGTAMIATFSATVTAGTYIRSLAPYIAERLGAHGLAYSIRRTTIGRYIALPGTRLGFWLRRYR